MTTAFSIFAGLVLVAYSMSRVTAGTMNVNPTGGNMALSNGPINIKQTELTNVPSRCLLNKDKGNCWNRQTRYHFNKRNGQCEPFYYGGCGGNWNRFQLRAECTSVCTCALAPETGPCRGQAWRWFYSPTDGCCRPFIYGGCGGNVNNYGTWTECSRNCGYPKAGSNWWKWGAEWGSGTGQQGTGGSKKGSGGHQQAYGQQDFMRDWFLWSLLMGGEGMEMEEMATMIAAGHMWGGAKGGSSQFGQGAGNAGANMHTWRPTRPGTFTPLGHVGSAANLWNSSGRTDMWGGANSGSWSQHSGMGLAGSQFGQTGSQFGLADSQFGQGGSQFGLAGSQFGQGGSQFGHGSWLTDAMNGNGYGGLQGSAFDVFRIIAELSSGELSQLDLNAVALVFGALDQTGRVDFDLLAQRLVASLMSNNGRNNMAALRGVAELLGTLDLEGNINSNMFLKALAGAVRRGAQSRPAGKTNINTQSKQRVSGSTGGVFEQGIGVSVPGGQPSSKNSGVTSTVGIIRQLQAGYLTPKDLGRLAKMFGVSSVNGVANIRVLADQLMRSLTAPGSGVSLSELRDLARSFNAFDINGNINIDAFFKNLLAALAQLTPNGVQNVAKTSAVEMHNIFRRIHSGTMRHNDLVGLAIRYGAREKNGNINIRLLANRMVRSLQTPSTSRDASLLRFVAQSLGALTKKGDINVNMFVHGMVKALQSVVPGSANSGWIIGTYSRPASGGSTAMEIIRIMGNMASGNLKPSDLQRLARRFGAMNSHGNVNINKLAEIMVRSLMGEAKHTNLADLKGIAMSFGALDRLGNINMEKFMKGLVGMFNQGQAGSWRIFTSGSGRHMRPQRQIKF